MMIDNQFSEDEKRLVIAKAVSSLLGKRGFVLIYQGDPGTINMCTTLQSKQQVIQLLQAQMYEMSFSGKELVVTKNDH